MDTEKRDRDLVSFRGQGIPEDPLPVMQDKADDPGALFVIAFRAKHLVECAEARVDASSKHRLFERRIGLYDGVSHLVGHLQKVELTGGEDAVDDGIHVVHVVILGLIAHGDAFAALHDQRIGRADVFEDLALGIGDRVEQALVIELGPGGRVDHIVIEKSSQTLLDGHILVALAAVISDRAVVELRHVLADGHARAVLFNEAVQVLDVIAVDIVVRVDAGDVFALRVFDPVVAGVGEASVFLVQRLDARVFRGVCVTHSRAVVRGSVVHHQDLQILISLTQNGFHTAVKILLYIVNR